MTERQLGIEAFREGRLREAVDRLSTATADHERTVSQETGFRTYAYLGAALYALGEAPRATEMFSSAVTIHAGSEPPLDLLINLANAYLASGRRQDAEQTLTRAVKNNPGAMEARLLLERLRSRDEGLPTTGVIFGESTQSVKRYIDTLSFSSTNHGYAQDEVRASLAQIRRYINILVERLTEKDQAITDQAAEIERLRQTEETLIENMMQARQEADLLRMNSGNLSSLSAIPGNGQNTSPAPDESDLTPLEKLFQKRS